MKAAEKAERATRAKRPANTGSEARAGKPSSGKRTTSKAPVASKTASVSKPTQAKPKVSKAPTAPSTPRSAKPATPRLRGSAGKKILADLGITNEELHAFLPADAPKWLRGVFWCQLDLAQPLEAIAQHFDGRYDVSIADSVRFPPDAPPEGIEIRTLIVRPPSHYCAYTLYPMRGDVYGAEGSYQLEASFREMGAQWGSNRAVYERFKALELPPLGATNVRELTE